MVFNFLSMYLNLKSPVSVLKVACNVIVSINIYIFIFWVCTEIIVTFLQSKFYIDLVTKSKKNWEVEEGEV